MWRGRQCDLSSRLLEKEVIVVFARVNQSPLEPFSLALLAAAAVLHANATVRC